MLYSIRTGQGKLIEDTIMSTVQKLMSDMNTRAVTKEEFQTLKNILFNDQGELIEDWLNVINQFTMNGRYLLAKQGLCIYNNRMYTI